MRNNEKKIKIDFTKIKKNVKSLKPNFNQINFFNLLKKYQNV